MSEASTKPYLIRAIHEWCSDSGFTPYLSVAVDDTTQVPREFVRAGEIVLNVSIEATNRLKLGNDFVEFQARFNGQARDIMIPIANVSAIYARENGHGMSFEVAKARPQGDDSTTIQSLPSSTLAPSDGSEPLRTIPSVVPSSSRTSAKPRSVPAGLSVAQDSTGSNVPKIAAARKLHSVAKDVVKDVAKDVAKDEANDVVVERELTGSAAASGEQDDPDKPTGGKPKLTRIK
jgi:stringent starvation protein B